MALSFKPIRPLLQTGTNKSSRIFSYVGLGIGVLLLLCAIQMYINIQSLLREGSIRKNGFDYISITKNVTNATQGQEELNLFRQSDIDELRKQSFIDGVAPLISNEFHVKLSAGAMIPFRTDMFLEALDNSYIDTVPPTFTWQPGQRSLPIILSSDFLEIYNVFAPGQGLPQVSRETASSLAVNVHCEGNDQEEIFIGKIAAFSDRINSVLVPKTFLDWANEQFGKGRELTATRLFIKTKDANNPDFLRFLDSKDYKLNKDKTILGRNKMVIDGIFSGLGIFGLLVVILALMLFSFYLQLVIARSRDSLQLLLTIGYSPAWLSRNFSRRFVPVYITIVITALAVTQLAQWAFHHFVMFGRPELSSFLHWGVLLVGVVLIILSIVTNYRLVRKLLYKLY